MRCPSCGHENPDDAGFCGECGSSLAQDTRCSNCGRENPSGQKFCHGCGQQLGGTAEPRTTRDPASYTPKHLADKILTSRGALEGERKQVTVLFADVKGSMELAEQVDPEEWHQILGRFFQILSDGVHRFEGTVNQYTGDGIMALFGAPIAHEDHARRACYAALYLRDGLRRYSDEMRLSKGLNFSVRIGLNSGEVVVGKIGDDLRMDYTAQGHTVGLAERMEQLAESGHVYVGEGTAHLVEGFFELRSLGKARIKGAAEPIRVYELEGVGALRTRLDVSRARGFSRFVGRADEMTTLELAFNRAAEGNGQVVGVVGEAGVGKSRLCVEFIESCRAKGISVYDAHCPAHGKAVPFLPLLELLRGMLDVPDRESPLKAREAITGRVLVLERDLEEFLPLVFEFLGVSDPEERAPALDPEARQYRLFAFVRHLVQALATREPSVILVDDLQWIDSASDGFLAQIVEAVSGSRAMVLANFRPEYRPEWMQRSHYQQLPLAPLGPEAVAELLDELLGEHESVAGLWELVRERTGGNPFFLEEVVYSLAESGALEGTPGRYRCVTPIERIEVPGTVQAVLAARIDRLGEEEKQVLQTASVIGKQFSERLLKGVAELPDPDLATAISALRNAEFIYEEALYPEVEYAFKHPLTQEVAYGSQLFERRRRIHAAVARAIETENSEKLDEEAALLAHHWEEAGEVLEATRWHRRAAQWIFLDPTAALQHAQRMRKLLAQVPESPETLELRIEALRFLLMTGSFFGQDEVEFTRLVQEGNELLSRTGDARAHALFLLGTGSVQMSSWHPRAALLTAEHAIARADETGDAELRAGARYLLALGHVLGGFSDRVLAVTEEAIQILGGATAAEADPSPQNPYQWLLSFRGWALATSGRLGEAKSALDRALELAIERGGSLSPGMVQTFYVYLEVWRGSFSSALAHARQSIEYAERVGGSASLNTSYTALGTAHLGSEQLEEARAALEHAVAVLPAPRGLNPETLARLAEACARLGDRARARQVAEEAVALADRQGVRFGLIPLSLARVLRRADGLAAEQEIEAALDRVLELVEETGARIYVPQVLEERAELARLHGNETAREHHLREACCLYTEMGATGHAERLARELGL